MLAKKVVFRDREIENERLELTDKGTLYFLGPHLTVRGCTLVLKVSARNLLIRAPTRFIDCTFDVKQPLKKHQDWICASLKGCRFKGRLEECDFGYWPDYGSDPEWKQGAIEDCDFSEAQLDACRFHGCDPATLRFPKWPCFTILDPIRSSPTLAAMDWPGDIARITMKGHAREPPSTVAVTWFAPTLSKDSGTTPEAIKAVVERCPGILF